MKKLSLVISLVAALNWACGSDSDNGQDAAPGLDAVASDTAPDSNPTDTLPGDSLPDSGGDTLVAPDGGDTVGLDSAPSDTAPEDSQPLDSEGGDVEGTDTVLNATFNENIAPLFQFHCGSCHGGTESANCSGVTCFATVYEHNLMNSVTCPGKTVGECSLVRIEDGTMPPGCPSCVTAEDKAYIKAWIDAGMPE